ncbi:MAG: L-threonylcarbamoyladenylate synthase [Bacteroidota bacterium]
MNQATSVEIAARCIQEGKVVAFPTETVYGLGANALNPIAVAKIFELKERPSFDPLIIHIADLVDINRLTLEIDARVFKIAAQFWPGPLTLVLPKSDLVPDIVTSGLSTVGIRMPSNEMAIQLIQKSGCPIAAPSANKFGRISPTTANHVKKNLPEVDYILDGGKTTVGIESTIIELSDKGFRVLRNGIITQEEIEAIIPFDDTAKTENMVAPGMLKSHYSPVKKMVVADKRRHLDIEKSKAGLLSFTGKNETEFQRVIRLSEKNDLKEYAVNMFDAMHILEEDDEIEIIVAEPVPETGIGKAIMDRLRKAEHNWVNH